MTKLRQDITGFTETVAQRDAQLKTVQDDLVKATNESKHLQENFEKVCNTVRRSETNTQVLVKDFGTLG